MPTVAQPPIADGQFDDAPEGPQNSHNQPEPERRDGHSYIDESLFEPSEESSEEDDDELDPDEDEGIYNRAEDEDWEVAERGMFAISCRRLHHYILLSQILPSSTIV